MAPVVADHGLQACRLQELWHMGPVVAGPRLYSAGSVVVADGLGGPEAMRSSETRVAIHVSCIGSQVLYH